MPVDAELIAGFPVLIEQAIAWGEMDSFNHVNNVVYFRYCENGRVEYIRRLGWFALMQTTGNGPIIASAALRFRRALRYPDTITIAVRTTQIDTDRFTLLHRIISHAQNTVAAEGEGVVVAYDYNAGSKAPLPDAVRSAIEQLEASCTGDASGATL